MRDHPVVWIPEMLEQGAGTLYKRGIENTCRTGDPLLGWSLDGQVESTRDQRWGLADACSLNAHARFAAAFRQSKVEGYTGAMN